MAAQDGGRIYVSPNKEVENKNVTAYTIPTRSPDEQVDRETATLIVNGINFQDWESVFVQLRWCHEYAYFRFTSVERLGHGAEVLP